MLRGLAGDLAGDASKTLLYELTEGPARAVAGEHGKIVNVYIGVAVGVGNLLVVYLGKPVVGGDGAAVGEYEAAYGVGYGRVLLYAPVGYVDVVVHRLLVVKYGGLHVAQLLPLLAVEYVGLGHVCIARLAQHLLHALLYVLHGYKAVLYLGLKVCGNLKRQQVYNAVVILLFRGLKGLYYGLADLFDIEFRNGIIPFDYAVHYDSPPDKF